MSLVPILVSRASRYADTPNLELMRHINKTLLLYFSVPETAVQLMLPNQELQADTVL